MINFFKNLTLKKIGTWFYKIVLGFVFLSVVTTILFRWIPIPCTPLMLIRCGQQAINGKELRLWKDWESLENISPNLQLAVVVSEDQAYLNHHGFDIEAMKKAFKANKKGRKLRGGSTISQQTAKNVFLWNGRNYIRKGLEAYFTLLIEIFWSKERIMEVYLNVAEFGEGIYGAQAASKYYFHKDAVDLKKSEAAALAVILPSPRKYNLFKPGPYIRKRTAWTLSEMRRWGYKLEFEEYKTDNDD
jgi:monofunctional biosynthetic peptidoglycan transglycosylase